MLTIKAFYFGETLQANTTSTFFVNSINSSSIFSFPFFVILDNESPPTTTAQSRDNPIYLNFDIESIS